MRVATVGCGYVADYYAATLPNHPQLELVGTTDRNPQRLARFSAHYDVRAYASLDELLADPSIDMVINLTNPSSHFEVSLACLEAGKHVYSEKPLAMQLDQARRLVELAEQRGLGLSAAPCGVLGESAQTAWKALRQKLLGKVYLAYAEMDDGLIHRTNYREWLSESGAPWPYQDEFEVGCTLEHAGYYLTWLLAFFGPARAVTSFAKHMIQDKHTDRPLTRDSPDFSVACIEFASQTVARLTCSIAAPPDRSLRIIGEDGVLFVKDCWDYGSSVYIRKRTPFTIRMEKSAWASRLLPLVTRRYPLVKKPTFQYRSAGATPMDFARGVAELADAVAENRPCRLSARFSLHVNELVLAIHDSAQGGTPRELESTFEPVEPMPWATAE